MAFGRENGGEMSFLPLPLSSTAALVVARLVQRPTGNAHCAAQGRSEGADAGQERLRSRRRGARASARPMVGPTPLPCRWPAKPTAGAPSHPREQCLHDRDQRKRPR
jgi:hypothetical protein